MPCTSVRATKSLPVHHNELYEYGKTSKLAHEVLILGSKAYTDALENMMAKIGHDVISVDVCERELQALGNAAKGGDAGAITARERC